MKIGNIVTYNKSKVELDQFHIFTNLSDINNTLPTLLVGYMETKATFKDLNFIDRKLTPNRFWTTSRLEDRHIFNIDLEAFMEHCESKIIEGFEYEFINPFETTICHIKGVINHIRSGCGLIHIDGPMTYFYVDGYTYGYHTDIADIYGVSNRRIIKLLHDNGYKQITSSEVESIQELLQIIDYDQSQLLFLKEKFALI